MNKEQIESMKKAAWELAKEGTRMALSVFIGYILDGSVAYFTKTAPTGQAMMAVAFVFRAADFYWHQYNKIQNPRSKEPQGIIPF